jgi:Bacterial Ig domain
MHDELWSVDPASIAEFPAESEMRGDLTAHLGPVDPLDGFPTEQLRSRASAPPYRAWARNSVVGACVALTAGVAAMMVPALLPDRNAPGREADSIVNRQTAEKLRLPAVERHTRAPEATVSVAANSDGAARPRENKRMSRQSAKVRPVPSAPQLPSRPVPLGPLNVKSVVMPIASASVATNEPDAAAEASFVDASSSVGTEPKPSPITAAAGPLQVPVIADASDPDGDVLDYRWSARAGTFADPASRETVFTCPEALETVSVTVTVTDSHGAAASDTVTVRCAAGP